MYINCLETLKIVVGIVTMFGLCLNYRPASVVGLYNIDRELACLDALKMYAIRPCQKWQMRVFVRKTFLCGNLSYHVMSCDPLADYRGTEADH